MAVKPPIEGVRVLRGPDWRSTDDTDGGEGHLGTVQASHGDGTVRVLWDIGQDSTYRAGQDGKFDLRIFDTATVGVFHPGTCCAGCGEQDIGGVLWHCRDCMAVDLCSICYADDKHELRHRFQRIGIPKAEATLMKKRNISVRIRAIGLFPGAKVTRGKNWEWKDQDGGCGSEGEVMEILQKANKEGKRNILRVKWPNGKTNAYRLAYHGMVDVMCTEEEAGWYYYRDHLPCLDASQFSTRKKAAPPSGADTAELVASPLPDDPADTQSALCDTDKPSLTDDTPNVTDDKDDTSQDTASAATVSAVAGNSGGLSSDVDSEDTSSHTRAGTFSPAAEAEGGQPGPEATLSSQHSAESEGLLAERGTTPSQNPAEDQDTKASTSQPQTMPETGSSDDVDEACSGMGAGDEDEDEDDGEKDRAETGVVQCRGSRAESSCLSDVMTVPSGSQQDADTDLTPAEYSQDGLKRTGAVDATVPGEQASADTEDSVPVDSSSTHEAESPNKGRGHTFHTSAAQDKTVTAENSSSDCQLSTSDGAQASEAVSDLMHGEGDRTDFPQDSVTAEVAHTHLTEVRTGTSSMRGIDHGNPLAAGSDVLMDSKDSLSSPEQTGASMSAGLPQEAPVSEDRHQQEMLDSETDCQGGAQESSGPVESPEQMLGTMPSLDQGGRPGETVTEAAGSLTQGHQLSSSPAQKEPTGRDEASGSATKPSQAVDSAQTESQSKPHTPGPSSDSTESSEMLTTRASSSAETCTRFEPDDQELGAAAAAAAPTSVKESEETFLLPEEMGATAMTGEISNTGGGGGGGRGSASTVDGDKFVVGQKAVICVPRETLREMQMGFGGVTHTMFKKIGREGTVIKILPSGAVHLRLGKRVFRLNPSALIRTYSFSVGDTVRIREDLYMMRVVNERIRWGSSMDQTAGKVGEVAKVDDDGDLKIQFRGKSYLYSPACCVPAPGCAVDSLGEHGLGSSFMDLNAGEGSLRRQLASLFSVGGRGGGGGHSIRLDDLGQMGQLGELAGLSSRLRDQLSQLTGGGGGIGDLTGIGLGDTGTPEGQLQKAVLSGDVQKIKDICRGDPGLLNRAHQGLTPLMLASHQAKRKALMALLDLGADVNAVGLKDQTALITALDEKEEEMALLLLEHGADARQRNGKLRTPLHSAVFNYQNEAAQILLHMGADINAQDKYGDTPLHDSVARQNVVMVDLLVQQEGINLQLVNNKGFTPLHIACTLENSQMVGLLLAVEGCCVNQLKDQDFSALHICAQKEFLEGIRLLLNVGNADVNLRSGQKKITALHLACLLANKAIVELLLEMGADTNVHDKNGETPLHLAMGGHEIGATSHLSQGSDVQTRVEIAKLLITHGAFVDAENHKGRPPTTYGRDSVQMAVMQFISGNPDLVQRKSSSRRTTLNMGSRPSFPTMTAEKDKSTLCRLCDGPTDLPLKPCGHRSVCRACAQVVHFCPVCGQKVQGRDAWGLGATATSDRQASPVGFLTSDTKEADTSFNMNNKVTETTAARASQREASFPNPPHGKRPQEQKGYQGGTVSTASTSAGAKWPQDRGDVSSHPVAGKAETCAGGKHETTASDSQSSRVGVAGCSRPFEGVTADVGASAEQTCEAGAETAVASSSSALGETASGVVDKAFSAGSAMSSEKKAATGGSHPSTADGQSDSSHPKQAVPSHVQPSEEASAPIPLVSQRTDVHVLGSEPEGDVLRVAVCRQAPHDSASAERVPTRADSKGDGECGLSGNVALFPEEKVCEDQEGQDNRGLTLTSETAGDMKREEVQDDLKPEVLDAEESGRRVRAGASPIPSGAGHIPSGAGHIPSGVDLEKEDLELPDLPSMPAGGVGVGDWVVSGLGGHFNLMDLDPSPMGSPLSASKAKEPEVSLSASHGELERNPWLLTDEPSSVRVGIRGENRPQSGSYRGDNRPQSGSWNMESSSHCQASTTEITRKEDPALKTPLHLANSAEGAERVGRLEDRGRASWLTAGDRTSLSGEHQQQKEQTHTATAEHGWPGPLSGEQHIQELIKGDFHSRKAGDVDSSAMTALEGQSHDQEGAAGGESTSSGNSAERTAVSQGARPKTKASMIMTPPDTVEIQHKMISKTEEGDTKEIEAEHDASLNPISSQRSPAQSEAAISSINRPAQKKKEDLHFDTASFQNLKSYIQTENLSIIFSDHASPAGPNNRTASNRATVSLDASALSTASSQRTGVEGTAPDFSGSSGQGRKAEGVHTLQRQLSASDSQLSSASGLSQSRQQQTATEFNPGKTDTADSVQQTSDTTHTESHPTPAQVATQTRGATPQDATPQPGNDQQRETSTDSGKERADDAEEEVKEGDRVVIGVTEERLIQLQRSFGETTKGMLQCIGKVGTVTGHTRRGAVCVKFSSLAYRFNRQAILRVHTHNVGDTVRIRNDLDLIKLLNKCVGYHRGWEETLGKVGTVTSIDQDGILTIAFGQSSFRYSPTCCVPAPGATPDSVRLQEGMGGAGASASCGESPQGETSERQAIMQELAKMVKGGASVDSMIISPGSDSSTMSTLFDAIQHDNLTVVVEMCQNDPSLVNGVHEGRQLTTLMFASWKGRLQIVRALVDMGADVNRRLELPREIRHQSRFPLSAALESKEEETAVFLLERGADPSACTAGSLRTPLHMAAVRNLVQVTQVLLTMQIDINARDVVGDTPLMDALQADSRAVVDILLQVPTIDLTVVNVKGMTLFHAACTKINISAVEEILTRDITHVNAEMEGGYAPLHLAAEGDCAEIIRLMALLGSADVNRRVGGDGVHSGDTPLHRACLRNNFTCVEALLDFGAEVNVANKALDTPLHFAMGGSSGRHGEEEVELYIQEERVRIACMLISNGAFVDAENAKGRTCMRYGHPNIVGAVQNFIDNNRHLVHKKGGGGGGLGMGGGGDCSSPLLVLRGAQLPCSVCHDQMSAVTFLPCGHKTACVTCAEKVTHCPQCQRRVDSTTTDDKKGALFEAIT